MSKSKKLIWSYYKPFGQWSTSFQEKDCDSNAVMTQTIILKLVRFRRTIEWGLTLNGITNLYFKRLSTAKKVAQLIRNQ